MDTTRSSVSPPPANGLIGAMSDRQGRALVQRCRPVNLVFGTALCEPNEPLRYVYFPLTGCISLLEKVSGRKPLEMGLIGNEGMLGATLVLGVNAAPLLGLVQGKGTALRMSATQLRRELHDSPRLRGVVQHYLYGLMIQLSRSGACLHFHSIEQRLARWLLMIHDRVQADHFHLTQLFLADMLGVRRSGITVVAGALQRKQLIRYIRGEIVILDRRGLEAVACECYETPMKNSGRIE